MRSRTLSAVAIVGHDGLGEVTMCVRATKAKIDKYIVVMQWQCVRRGANKAFFLVYMTNTCNALRCSADGIMTTMAKTTMYVRATKNN